MTQSMNRREFLELTAGVAAMLGLSGCAGIRLTPTPTPRMAKPIAPGAKIRIAQVGFNGKGYSDISSAAEGGAEVVALCDVDWSLPKVKEIFEKFPNAKRFKDFREMLIEMDDQIDAVGVATPDHMHFLPAYMAITMGKHVYVQKPLTQTVWEADMLLKAAREHGVCTQMGNQGHAGEGCRLVKEWMNVDLIGAVREIHIWTNRPVWPQTMQEWPAAQEPNKDLDWDKWLGRAPKKTYNKVIHPFNWRGYRDYGAGALGDMGCHIMDAAFWALDLHLVDPISIEAETEGLTEVSYPKSSKVTYKFPARGKFPELTLTWYDGGRKPPRPAGLEASRQLAIGGQLIVGAKATIYDSNDYCNSPRLIPDIKNSELKVKDVPKTIPRVPKNNPHTEWLTGIMKNDPHHAGSNFEYSVPLTKMVVLGNFAVLTGKLIKWDGTKLRCTNVSAANKYVKPVFRKGWAPKNLPTKKA